MEKIKKSRKVWSGKTSPGGPQRENCRAAIRRWNAEWIITIIIIIIIIINGQPYNIHVCLIKCWVHKLMQTLTSSSNSEIFRSNARHSCTQTNVTDLHLLWTTASASNFPNRYFITIINESSSLLLNHHHQQKLLEMHSWKTTRMNWSTHTCLTVDDCSGTSTFVLFFALIRTFNYCLIIIIIIIIIVFSAFSVSKFFLTLVFTRNIKK